MELEVLSTIHDEARQGESYSAFSGPDILSGRRFYIESYGCAMNFADSEVVASILEDAGFTGTQGFHKADLVLSIPALFGKKQNKLYAVACTFSARQKDQNLRMLIGVLGCMAERLKSKFLEEEKLVDLVVGPDAYRSFPALIEEAETGQKAVNVLLSRDETYADISPVRLNSNGVTAFRKHHARLQ